MRKTNWSGYGMSTVCTDSRMVVVILPVDCDSKMKSNTKWHYSTCFPWTVTRNDLNFHEYIYPQR